MNSRGAPKRISTAKRDNSTRRVRKKNGTSTAKNESAADHKGIRGQAPISSIIASQAFVDRIHRDFKDHFSSKHDKKPKIIHGLEGVYSLKRLSEAI